MSERRVALVHDYLIFLRGAERTFLRIADCWPDAPIHTTAYSPKDTEGRFAGRDVHTSFLERLRVRRGNYRAFLPLYPRAVESLSLAGSDVIEAQLKAIPVYLNSVDRTASYGSWFQFFLCDLGGSFTVPGSKAPTAISPYQSDAGRCGA